MITTVIGIAILWCLGMYFAISQIMAMDGRMPEGFEWLLIIFLWWLVLPVVSGIRFYEWFQERGYQEWWDEDW